MTADKLNQVVAASIPVVANEEIFQNGLTKFLARMEQFIWQMLSYLYLEKYQKEFVFT